MVPVLVMAAVAAGSLLAAAPGSAQRLATAEPAAQEADSARTVARARTAQAGFERYRYLRLPRTQPRGNSGRCDEVIGRFCFWFDDDPTPDPPPPEPPAIIQRRGALLDVLATAAGVLPGDGWIAGQRVRYLLEHGDEAAALDAARACRAEPWWCSALEGLALHEAQRFTEAQAAFDSALGAMPAEQAALWTDVSDLLTPADQRELRRLPEAERAALARRLWWLADPLWSDAGNDRLTEHYARWTMHAVQARARQVDRLAWRDDTREVLVRYGWWTAWERLESLFYGSMDEGVVAYNDPLSWEWMAPLSAVRAPHTLRGDAFPLEVSARTPTRYAPEYAARVLALPHQLAVFPRPGGAVLVAGYALDADSLPAMPRLHATAVAMADAEGARTVSPWQPTAAAGALRLDLPGRSAVVSVEVQEDSTRLLARWRQGVAWEGDARVSDLLLLAHPEARPEDLDQAARLARGSARVRPGERLGLFWEMYGLAPGDSVTVRVGLSAPQAGWTRRQLEAVGIARGTRPARMGWRDAAAEGEAIAPRTVAVGIPTDVRPGEYTLELTVSLPGRPDAVARRTLTVVEDNDVAR